ncbi:MAG: hypothetical protein HRF40_00715 [Nitrososphaera sp.]
MRQDTEKVDSPEGRAERHDQGFVWRKDAIDIYDHIDKEELRKAYLAYIPRWASIDR